MTALGHRQRDLLGQIVDTGGMRIPPKGADRAVIESLERRGLVTFRDGAALVTPKGADRDAPRRHAHLCGLCANGFAKREDAQACEEKHIQAGKPKRRRKKRRCLASGCDKEYDTIRGKRTFHAFA